MAGVMSLRERREQYEIEHLSPFACKAAHTKGRARPQPMCDLRTEFQKDRDKITHSKAFRRLMHKTQVFISPEGDHYRTRLTHTLEVAQIARTVARGLALNEDLTEAIALGHDLGHTPFGHTGEDALAALLPGGFRHNEQSVRVVEVLEHNGAGLNLTAEVIDGILHHRTESCPATLEGAVVRVSDKIAYMNHDIDDALRAGLLSQDEIPREITDTLGETSRERIDFLVHDFIAHSAGRNEASLTPGAWETLRKLRAFLYERVYQNQLQLNERKKIAFLFRLLYEHYTAHPEELPPAAAAADYIAGMTDRFALKRFEALYIPAAWRN